MQEQLVEQEIEALENRITELEAENEELNYVLEALNEILLLSDDPSRLYERIIAKPQLCILLNPELTHKQIFSIAQELNIVQVEHEGEKRFAVLLAVHETDPEKETELIALIED